MIKKTNNIRMVEMLDELDTLIDLGARIDNILGLITNIPEADLMNNRFAITINKDLAIIEDKLTNLLHKVTQFKEACSYNLERGLEDRETEETKD